MAYKWGLLTTYDTWDDPPSTHRCRIYTRPVKVDDANDAQKVDQLMGMAIAMDPFQVV